MTQKIQGQRLCVSVLVYMKWYWQSTAVMLQLALNTILKLDWLFYTASTSFLARQLF